MKCSGLQFILMLTVLGSASAWAATNDLSTNAASPAKLSYIVTLRREADQDGCARTFSVQRHHIFRHALNGFAANLDAATVAKLRHDPRVLAVEPDGEFVLCSQTVPTGIVRMGITNFPVAHINGMDNRINVDVAVLDTGIQTNHPDLNVFQAVDCTGYGWNDDWNGHGTQSAGIIGALDNDFGVVGVAPGVRLWSVQVYVPGQASQWSWLIAGCDYISAHADKISIVNASLGGAPFSSNPYLAVHLAISNLVGQGIVFVASAGNAYADISGDDLVFGTPDDIIPAALPEVMAVSAMNPTNDTIATYSNYSLYPKSPSYVNSPGLGIDITAPGENILSTYIGGGYAIAAGTSAAAPHVAGLVAVYIAANGRATNAAGVYRIRQAIVDNSLPQSQWQPQQTPNSQYLCGPGVLCPCDPDGNPEPLAMPSENWVPPPKITSESMTAQGFQISFPTVPGYTYTVQYRTSLSLSNQWISLTATNGAGSLTTVTVADPNPSDTRFYRLARQATP